MKRARGMKHDEANTRRMKHDEASRGAALALKEAFTVWTVKENTPNGKSTV